MGIGVLHEVSTDELRLRLVADETVVGRLRARQMETIRELDRRQTAPADGCGSLAEWVAGRVDMAPETAQKLVTTAEALGRLAYVADALADGATTYDRAAEIARIATACDELEILVGSYDFDIAGLRRQTARRNRVTRRDEEQAFSERYLSVQPTLDGMSWRIHGRLTGAAGVIVTEALTARAEGFGVFPDGTRAPPVATSRRRPGGDLSGHWNPGWGFGWVGDGVCRRHRGLHHERRVGCGGGWRSPGRAAHARSGPL